MNRIVIADDSATARMFIRRCLEIIGLGEATLIEAENGREALSLLKEEDTDLLLTDLNMPVMDGATLLKWVKSSPRLHDIPVLVITSAGNPAKEQELTALGAFGVLNKPVSPSVLMDALQSLMS
ncbi:MAG: response regulator [Desulfuromonadaceae bacterium]|nr:response regulator [Desulfuromonadaceae bacterium]